MWKEGDKVIFIVRVVERDVIAISNAAVTLCGQVATSSSSSGSIEKPGFKASAVFVGVQKGLDQLSPPEKEKLIKKTNAVFSFIVTAAEKHTWYVDMKRGTVGTGSIKSDVTVQVSDADFVDLASGRLQAQKAFMSGKIKVSGNLALAGKLEGVLALAKGAKL